MQFEYETDRLILKILKPDAASLVLDFYMRDKELFESYEPERPLNFYTISHQRTLLKCEYELAFKLQTVRFYVFLKENPDVIIGTICFYNILKSIYSNCDLGYKFSTAYQHMGYATEAILLGIWIIFEDLKLHRINAWVMPDNQASIKLLERLGFEREGLCKKVLPMRGQWQDHFHYAMISPHDI